MTDLRFPIGEFVEPSTAGPVEREVWIGQLEDLPRAVRAAVQELSPAQLDTPYRPGGWTVRQVVHHLPDSHFNAYNRFKLALTEEVPTVRPYDEARWAELPDSRQPVEVSLDLLEALHRRWVVLLRALEPPAWSRTFYHPGSRRTFTLERTLAMYAWHGRHHTAHVTSLRVRQGW